MDGGNLGRPALAAVLGVLALWSLVPLITFLVHGNGSYTGADGRIAGDQHQYLAWVRDFGGHLLAQNDFDLSDSAHVFLHPMFLLSGLGWRTFGSIEIWLIVWKPVAVAVLCLGFACYVRRMIRGRSAQAAALVLAIFFATPATPLADWLGAGEERMAGLGTLAGELAPAWELWGYLPTVIAVGLMPLFLLGLERLLDCAGVRSRRSGGCSL